MADKLRVGDRAVTARGPGRIRAIGYSGQTLVANVDLDDGGLATAPLASLTPDTSARPDILVNVFDDDDEYICRSVPLRDILGDDDSEYDDIVATLDAGNIYSFGGGAVPHVNIERAHRQTIQ